MPDPLQYAKAIGLSAFVGAAVVLLLCVMQRRAAATRWNVAALLALSLGIASGCGVLSLPSHWPPRNALDRFVTLVLPALIAVELVAALPIVPWKWAWLLRAVVAVAAPRILLHGSVYLNQPAGSALTLLGVCALVLAGVWGLLLWLSRRAPGLSIPFAISLTTLCAGGVVMMGGYLKGGAAALPLAATLAAVAGVSQIVDKRAGQSALIGVGTIGLFSLLLIGRCFGRVSTGHAMTLLATPLLCWVSELPFLRTRPAWLVESLRLTFVVLLLAVVWVIAKGEFDRVMAPLLTVNEWSG